MLAEKSGFQGLPLVFTTKGQAMRLSPKSFVESIFSFALFAAITLAVASIAYQALNPDGALFNWLRHIWDADPISLILIGGIGLFIKRWLDGVQGAQAADLMFFVVAMLGLYYGFNLLIGT
jgi:hypothetical protein